ncbi:MAG: hypothetical protein P4L46_01400 [Fimbriimonas sp.]|nr:hypothetical protein [Fimbriimonas sp.]
MDLAFRTEPESYEFLLIMHLEAMHHELTSMKPEHWDWSPDQAAPTPKTVAVHAWQWLMCDRQHINQPDTTKHADVAEPSENPEVFLEQFKQEIENWRQLLRSLSPAQLDEPRSQFGGDQNEMNVRFFILHMIQNAIYKHGQLSESYFALGYDGTEPYTAPFPNEIYAQVRQMVAEGIR